MSAMKNIKPTICQKDFAGLAKLKSSTITPFHKSFPTKARMIKESKKEMMKERDSA